MGQSGVTLLSYTAEATTEGGILIIFITFTALSICNLSLFTTLLLLGQLFKP